MTAEPANAYERADALSGDQPDSGDRFVRRNLRHNSLATAGNFVFVGAAMAFVSATTVIPSLVSQLTSSALMVGLVAAVDSGGWLVPQLLAASYVADKPLKKRYMLVPAFVGRMMYFILPAAMLLIGAANHEALLLAVFTCFALFVVGDSLCVVPWLDLLAKVIPADRRGRVMGVSQTISYALAIAIGPVVGWVLSHPDLGFPSNYALLFALSGAFWMLSWVSVLLVKEPPQPGLKSRQSFLGFVGQLRPILRGDASFRRLLAARLLLGGGMMVYPFYVVYAREAHGLGPEWVGFFVSAQMAGSMLGGIGFGALCDRRGTKAVIVAAAVLGALAPGLALATGLLPQAAEGASAYVFAAVFASVGVLMPAFSLGFMNSLLESSPPDARPTYVGLFNTLCGTLLVAPPLLGLLLQATSYSVVFGVGTLSFALGLVVAVGLTDPRRRPSRAAAA